MKKLMAEDLSFSYGNKLILSGTTISLLQGDIHGLVGLNGCGKSTLIKKLLGVEGRPIGTVHIDNTYIPDSKRWRYAAYLPQDHFLPRDLTVSRAVRIYTESKRDWRDILSDPRLNDLKKRRVGTLSGGEMKYLQLLIILSLKRDFYLLDEPFSGIEPKYISLIRGQIKMKSEDKGILITDHDHYNIHALCDHLSILKGGCVHPLENNTESLVRAGYLPDSDPFK